MPTEQKTHPLDQSSLYKLVRRGRLAQLVGLSDGQLRHVTKHADTLYRECDIPKKNGTGTRHIEDPAKLLKRAQGRLAGLLGRISPPDFLFCPVKRRCYVTNAAQHVGNRVVRSLDIKKYFPNTKSRRVFWFFHDVMKCDRAIAGTLTRLSCFKEHLPTGSPLSPILAFFAHIDMWEKIASICQREGLTLTVYVDDVTVSGAVVPERVIWEIKEAIQATGLRYHKEKTSIDCPAEITGVFVAGDRIEVPNKQFKKLREQQAAAKSAGPRQSKRAQAKLDGLKGQVSQIKRVATSIKTRTTVLAVPNAE